MDTNRDPLAFLNVFLCVQVGCKAVMVFFHYCVMSNYFWLFIEGLYLFTLLVETFFPERRYFYWYTIIGWGMSQRCIIRKRIVTGLIMCHTHRYGRKWSAAYVLTGHWLFMM